MYLLNLLMIFKTHTLKVIDERIPIKIIENCLTQTNFLKSSQKVFNLRFFSIYNLPLFSFIDMFYFFI